MACDLSAAVEALDLAVPSQYLQVPAHGGRTDREAGRYLIHRRALAQVDKIDDTVVPF